MSVRSLDPGAEPLRALLVEARIRHAERFPPPAPAFEAAVWCLGPLQDRAHRNGERRAYLCRYGSRTEPLPPPFGDAVRAWLVLTADSVANFTQKLDAARMLWRALERRGAGEGMPLREVRDEDLRQAEHRMREAWALSTTYRTAGFALDLVRFLSARGVCRPPGYVVQTARVEDASRTVIDQRADADGRLPTRAALEGLADIYRELAVRPADRLRAAALAVIAVTGLRVGEVLTLPEACEVEEESGGRRRYGLRYYSEKQRGGSKLHDVYWCTDVQAALVRRAVAEVREITAPARARAALLEASPGRAPLPGYGWADRLSPDQTATVLGLGHRNALSKVSRDALPRHQDADGPYYRAADVERYLLGRMPALWTLDRRDGTRQSLSESLLVVPLNFFHAVRGILPLVVQPVTLQDLSDFLAGRGNVVSAYARLGVREPDGAPCRMTTHQLRHFVNDTAERGGMPIDLLTRWMNRSNPRDTRAYLHMSPRERARWAVEGIRAGEIAGAVADAYRQLPEGVRERFLEDQVAQVHHTGVGLCVHDWSVEPCPYHLNCLGGCKHYLRRRGDDGERRALVQIGTRTRAALAAARREADEANDPDRRRIADAWRRAHERTLAGVEAALAVEDGVDDDGVHVPVFAGGG